MKEIKKFFEYLNYYVKNFKDLDRKTKEKSILVIIYVIFFTILLKFPILLVRETILYFMTIYEIPNITMVDIISRIVVEVVYLIVVLVYFPKNFNKRLIKTIKN
ncbi:MAG: hypothetical protein J5892_01790 [Bacilli bacterium]|nr:hypothetical protein [Bacilli bacterium]